jgi:hypothetical protein
MKYPELQLSMRLSSMQLIYFLTIKKCYWWSSTRNERGQSTEMFSSLLKIPSFTSSLPHFDHGEMNWERFGRFNPADDFKKRSTVCS